MTVSGFKKAFKEETYLKIILTSTTIFEKARSCKPIDLSMLDSDQIIVYFMLSPKGSVRKYFIDVNDINIIVNMTDTEKATGILD